MTLHDLWPHPAEIAVAARQTRLLVRTRWRLIRKRRARAIVWIGLAALLGMLFAVSNLGGLVRRYADSGAGTAAGQYAVNYVIALQRGDLGAVGAAALGSALAASLFSPFTGAANLALAAADDLTILRPNRLHRYFDALATAGISTIGFLQLFSLTAVASLLTLDGGRTAGLLLTWAIWPTLVLASVAEGWAIELVHRAYGPRIRRGLGLGLGVVLAGVLAIDPSHGQTLFGLGTAYANTLRAAAVGNTPRVVAAAGLIIALWVVLFFGGLLLCRIALSKPAVPVRAAKPRRQWLRVSHRPQTALFQILVIQMVRTAEVRRPLATVLLLGIPAVWVTGSASTTMTTLVLAVPLAVALAWGVNAFGVLGPGMTWLASQPRVMRSLLPLIVGLQLAITALITALCWVPPLLGGHVRPGDVAAVAAGTAVATALTTRSAANKAVRKPMLARLGSRGDVIVPPLTAMNYTLRFALWGGMFGMLTVSQDNGWLQLGLVSIATAWSGFRFMWLMRTWRNREHQARLVATVAPA